MVPLLRSAPAFALLLLFSLVANAATQNKATTAILVDKKTNTLKVTEYIDGEYKLIKEYHTTLGKVKGDKEEEGDLKTPEGIYTFTTKRTPPSLLPKYGIMAFPMNYPNPYDEIAGRDGFGILLHATDTPDRLKENYDSEGCVVVENLELKEIEKSIRIGLTPILVFEELKPEQMKPGKNEKLREFFNEWIAAWETKDVNKYIEHYHSDFKAQGMDKSAWKAFKAGLNSRYNSIKIGPEDVRIYTHPKYAMLTFTQNYHSTLKGGGEGHRSRGTKILYIAEESGKPKIIAETYTTLMW